MKQLSSASLSKRRKMELKKEWIRKDHYISYPKAEKLLKELLKKIDKIDKSKEDNIISTGDLNSICIVGESGCGKTMLFKEFASRVQNTYIDNCKRYKTVYTICEDTIAGVRGLYSTLYTSLGHPYGNKELTRTLKIKKFRKALNPILNKSNILVFGIDEFQHLDTRTSTRRKVLNCVKDIILNAPILFIPIGTPLTIEVLQSYKNQKLFQYCQPTELSTLSYWKNDKILMNFINDYEKSLPFEDVSGLIDYKDLIFSTIQIKKESVSEAQLCNLRDLVNFIKYCSLISLNNYESHISIKTIEYVSKLMSPNFDNKQRGVVIGN